MEHLNSVLDSKIGSLAFVGQPKFGFMSLLIHPLLIAINNCLKTQLFQNEERE